MSEPFYWEARKAWYVNLTKADGRRGRVKLHATKKRAFELWKAMDPDKAATDPLLATIADHWIGHLKARVKCDTLSQGHLENATGCVVDFLSSKRNRRWSEFTRDSVTEWVAEKPWRPSTQRKRMGLLRSLSAYGHEEHKLPDNLANIKKPSETSREYFATADDYRRLVDCVMGGNKLCRPFALYLAALWHTGARPSELGKAQIKHLRGDAIILGEHKNRRKIAKPRTIYLDGRAMAAVNAAIDGRTDPEAYIFLNSRGKKHNKDSVRNRISAARAKLNLSPELVAYSLRHGYAHRALSSGVEVATLATLIGSSVEVIMRTYGHLHDNQGVLAMAAKKVK